MLIIGVNKKYLRNILTVLALLLTAFALPSVTQAEVEFYRYSAKGRAAEADFSSVDKSGCVYTYVNVEAVDGSIKTKGKPEAAYVASVYISQNDWCTETYLEAYTNGYVELAEGDFQIDDKLNSATLNTAIELYDNYSGNSLPLDISIN